LSFSFINIIKRKRQVKRKERLSQSTQREERIQKTGAGRMECWKRGDGTRYTVQGARAIQNKGEQRSNHESTKGEGVIEQ
jgi:hypothetical protein